MEIIKNLVVDSFNGLSVKDIPLFILQLMVAGVLAYVVQLLINKKLKNEILNHAPIIAISIALVVSIVKYSLPFAILALPILMWLKPKSEANSFSKVALLIIGVIGIGCGVGSIIQTVLGVIVLGGLFFIAPVKIEE